MRGGVRAHDVLLAPVLGEESGAWPRPSGRSSRISRWPASTWTQARRAPRRTRGVGGSSFAAARAAARVPPSAPSPRRLRNVRPRRARKCARDGCHGEASPMQRSFRRGLGRGRMPRLRSRGEGSRRRSPGVVPSARIMAPEHKVARDLREGILPVQPTVPVALRLLRPFDRRASERLQVLRVLPRRHVLGLLRALQPQDLRH